MHFSLDMKSKLIFDLKCVVGELVPGIQTDYLGFKPLHLPRKKKVWYRLNFINVMRFTLVM